MKEKVRIFTDKKIKITLEYEKNNLTRITIKEEKRKTKQKIIGRNTKEAKAILEYFEGKGKNFDDIKLNLETFSEKERKVLEQMRKIKYGELISYKKLAEMCGNKKMARFIGNVCAKNPFPIIIPCHRVIKTGGSIGNYTAGKKNQETAYRFGKKVNNN